MSIIYQHIILLKILIQIHLLSLISLYKSVAWLLKTNLTNLLLISNTWHVAAAPSSPLFYLDQHVAVPQSSDISVLRLKAVIWKPLYTQRLSRTSRLIKEILCLHCDYTPTPQPLADVRDKPGSGLNHTVSRKPNHCSYYCSHYYWLDCSYSRCFLKMSQFILLRATR